MFNGRHRYSELYTYFKCPKLFELTRIKGLSDGSEHNGDLLFGSAIHLAIQDILEGGEGTGVFEVFIDSLSDDVVWGKLDKEALLPMGKRLLEIFKEEHKADIVPEHIEQRLEVELNGVKIGGTPDCLGLYKGIPSVIDFKTSAMPYDNIKGFVDAQMPLYAAMAKEIHGFEAKQGVYIVLVKDPRNPRIQVKKQTFDSKFILDRLSNTLLTFKQIEAMKEFPRNSASCKTWAGLCPLFKECYE
jgi:hypothetical protein